MNPLPFPKKRDEISKLLEPIDERLLNCSEKFIRLQIKKPIEKLLSGKIGYFDSNNPQYEWFNVYSVYSANQQINEACNKLWATVELANITSKNIWKNSYLPMGEGFSGTFLLGTVNTHFALFTIVSNDIDIKYLWLYSCYCQQKTMFSS